MPTPYATLDYCKQTMVAAQPTSASKTIDDKRVISLIRGVSARIDGIFKSRRPFFAPWNESRNQVLSGDRISSYYNTFLFDGWLLELNSAAIGSTTYTGGTQVTGYPDSAQPPWNELFLANYWSSWYGFCASYPSIAPQFVSINGIWGFHSDYANAWQAVDALQAAITTTTTTTLTVASVLGADLYGLTPRFSIGNLLRIDSEYLLVTNANPQTNVLTVLRGQNGTTAATHLIAATVSTWTVEELVQRAVARQVGLMLARSGAYTTVEVAGMGSEVRFPADLLSEVRGLLDAYSYR